MAEPMSTSAAAGGALIKIFGLPVLAGSLAAALGFIFLWPKTKGEAFARFASSIVSSATAGPLLVVWLRSYSPGLFESAKDVATMYGADQAVGFLFIAAPIMVAAGLPAWWLIGGFVKWFENRRSKDIGEMLDDATASIKKAKEAL
ncbi:MAG: hypothetical protein A3I66_01500 [Burkholderiales bacterium RIFCSPLOWO2_02_FULL_57_36]|nr:MAG: hypothetical protein A3I66_01500 [Burkholderiales bacterium RIFCSPLOWO2_02_FULL_57_36]